MIRTILKRVINAVYNRKHHTKIAFCGADLPVKMNPIVEGTEPNYWLSAMIIDEAAMCAQVRDDSKALCIKELDRVIETVRSALNKRTVSQQVLNS